MTYLILAVYIIVSTYYLIGILDCYDAIVEGDSVLRTFLREVKSGNFIAIGLILIASYAWPVAVIVRPFIMRWYNHNIRPVSQRRSQNAHKRHQERFFEAA